MVFQILTHSFDGVKHLYNHVNNAMARFSKFRVVSCMLLCLVVYNEWLSYGLKLHTWPSIPSEEGDSIRVLFVADPQLLSRLSETTFPFNLVNIWDATRFVRRSFRMALQKGNPDVVIFMGDLMNDGSLFDDDEYKSHVKQFKSTMSLPSSVKHVVYLPGDNDIGGEGLDRMTPHLLHRFYHEFNQDVRSSYLFLEMIHVNVMNDNLTSLTALPPPSNNTFRILLSHIPLSPLTNMKLKKTVVNLKPSFIFSGHEHDSFHFGSSKGDAQAIEFWPMKEPNNVWTFETGGEKLHEITVPTCSYRMGKPRYGYGLAVIAKTGLVQYCVLWLPSRFSQLQMYLFAVVLLLIIMLPRLYSIIKVVYCTRESSSASKIHHT